MNDTDIFVKTEAGTQEVRSRTLKLPQRLRTMLIMIDGSLSAPQLQQAADQLGAPSDFLAALEAQGLVRRLRAQAAAPSPRPAPASADSDFPPTQQPAPEPSQPVPAASEHERFSAAKQFLNDTAVDALGLRAFFFTLKLEKCCTRADLAALLPDYEKVITKGSGAEVARTLKAQARSRLG